jgi:hypothetical protein
MAAKVISITTFLVTLTYKEITKIITKMKSAASPCPLDQISIIAFKKCPYLRTQLWRILTKVWQGGKFPSVWKEGVTVLAYKKGSPKDPENFRPITLQPVLSKIYTSLIRNRLYTFTLSNKYIESNLQKGFWDKISGVVEHTETLSHVVNHARKKQKSLVVTLLDLKNAFGELDHKLLISVLKYHHVPPEMIELISSLYTDYHISITTNDFMTDPVNVKRGVLQGDSLSPLLFNLVINTLIYTVKQDKINCMGYVYDGCIAPKHWMQFADDTALVTALETDNQYLCNAFTKWASWAGLIIRVDKCHVFGMKKNKTDIVQYKPYVKIKNDRIPPVEEGESFTYLGKDFNMHMSDHHVKENLIDEVRSYLRKIDLLPLHPLHKTEICQHYVFSKLKWRFTIYNLTETWVNQKIDSELNRYYRKWLQIPISGNITHLSMPKGKLGLNIKLAKYTYQQCKLTVRRILKCSMNDEAKKLCELTSTMNVRSDSIVNKAITDNNIPKHIIKSRCTKLINTEARETTWNNFMDLKEQSVIIKHILKVTKQKEIQSWQSLLTRLPITIHNFCRRYLIVSLANNANLYKWKLVDNSQCCLCNGLQTQKHVFNNCVLALERYTWRHNSILKSLCNQLMQKLSSNFKLYVDGIAGFPNPSQLFRSTRPDLIVKEGSKITAIELTCPYETNTDSSREYKQNRYKNLRRDLLTPTPQFELILLEITSLGFITENVKDFENFLKKQNFNTTYITKTLQEVSIRCSYYIYCRRNKEWIHQELLSYG